MRHFIPLSLTLSALALAAPRAHAGTAQQEEPFQSVTGVVAEVRPLEKQLVLRVRKGEFLQLTADDRTRIDFPQTEGKLAKLAPGKRVRVNYYVKGGTNRLLSVTEPLLTLGKLKQGISLALTFVRGASFQEREEYKKNLKTILQDAEENLLILEAKADMADADGKKAIAKDVEELRRQRDAVRERLARVDAATADNWAEVRDNLNRLLEDLQRVIERARARAAEKGRP